MTREPLISQVWPLAGFDWKPTPFNATWVGRRYVGGAMAQGATTLLLWDDIAEDPILVNESHGWLLRASGDPTGARVGLAIVYPADPNQMTSHDPAGVVRLELDPLDGRIVLGADLGARFDYLRPTMEWSPDGMTLAVGGLSNPASGGMKTAILAMGAQGGPIRWLDAPYPVVWNADGLGLRAPGASVSYVHWNGLGDVLEPRPLPAWRSRAGHAVECAEDERPVWIGPDRVLRVADVLRVVDLRTGEERPLLAPELSHLTVRDFSADGTLATLESEDALYWTRITV